ncbi:MAG TPA: hypothetical protein VFH68_18235 [Polyangia bacterium]|jgi:hypothetical protein|nr:hypothetical protein [Polyangia bacterium]
MTKTTTKTETATRTATRTETATPFGGFTAPSFRVARIGLAALSSVIVLAGVGGVARAQKAGGGAAISAPAPAPARTSVPATAAGGAAAADAPKVKVERGAGGHKVYRITEEIRIEGKIQKPEAFFFYQKSSISYDWQELKKDFIPKILDSVSKAPF